VEIPAFGTEPGCFSSLSYNIRYENHTDGPFVWANRKDAVVKLLQERAPDIFGLQEVLESQLDHIAYHFPQHDFVAVGRDNGQRAGEMVPIFWSKSKYQRLDQGTFWLSDDPYGPNPPGADFPWGNKINRIATWVRLVELATGKHFFVMNTHLDHQSHLARSNSILQIRRFFESLPTIPFVLMGDFNMNFQAVEFASLTIDGYFANAMSMSLSPPLLNRELTTITQWTHLVGLGTHIDHILVNNVARVLNYEMLHRQFVMNGQSYFPSDHLPVAATICMD
jgi:endonuclease/exonuclease/phosphatase family metal-dependent hydrolase